MNENSKTEELIKRVEALEREVAGKEKDLREKERQLEGLLLRLSESDEKFRSIFHSAIVGIAMTDGRGKFILSNDMWNQMLGYTPREMRSLTNLDITHPDDIESSREYSMDLINGRITSIRTEKRYIRRDQSTIWVDLSVSAVNLHDGLRFFGVATDITQKKLGSPGFHGNARSF
jgi:PAS domain S-box-containing protein